MRKVFLDMGAHDGCSVRQFIENWDDWQEYEFFSFEPDKGRFDLLNETYLKYKLKGRTYKTACGHITGRRSFDGWKLGGKVETGGVPCLNMSVFIQENFSKDDYIIMKFDIEGEEYNMIEIMHQDKTLEYINEAYGELHGPKKGYKVSQNNHLLDTLEKYGLKCGQWDALEGKFEECYIVKMGTPGSITTKSTPRTGVNYLYVN